MVSATARHDLVLSGRGATDVSSQAVKQLLALDELEYRWSVAAYVAWGRQGRQEADEEQMKKGLASECHHFVRANFQEIESPQASEGWLYTTKALQLLPRLSHRETLCVPLKFTAAPSKPLRPEPEGADAKLKEDLTQYDKTPSLERSTSCCKLCASNGTVVWSPPYNHARCVRVARRTVDGSNALHCAAFKLNPELVTALVQRGGSINSVDQAGYTPLMVAAGTVRGRTGGPNRHQEDLTCIERLLQHGADASLIDDRGLTALGVYRMSVRHYDDFNAAFNRPREERKSSCGSNSAPSWRTHARR